MAMSRSTRRWMLGVASIFVILFILLILTIYFAPVIVLSVASKWYADQGDGYTLSVTDWHFKPFETTLSLYGVELKHPHHGNGSTHLAVLSINLQSQLLLDNIIDIRELTLDGLDVEIVHEQHDGEGFIEVAGLRFPIANNDNLEERHDNKDSKNFLNGWDLVLNNISITDQKIKWDVVIDELFTRGQIELMQLQVPEFSGDLNASLDINADFELQKFEYSGYQDVDLYKPMHIVVDGNIKDILINPQWSGDVSFDYIHLKLPDGSSIKVEQILIRDVVLNLSKQKFGEVILSGMLFGYEDNPVLVMDYYNFNSIDISPPLEDEDALDVIFGQQVFSGFLLNIHRDMSGIILGIPDVNVKNDTPVVSESLELGVEDTVVAGDVNSKTVKEDVLLPDLATESADLGISTNSDLIIKKQNTVVDILLAGITQNVLDGSEAVKGSIVIEDKSIKPVLKTTLMINDFNVGKMSAHIEDDEFNLEENISISILAGFDRFNTIKIDSHLGIFERDADVFPQGNIKITIRQLDLVAFNGYLINFIGYQLERGMLDLDANITINKAQLGGQIKILLRNSRFVPVNKATIERVGSQMSMPVDTALELLRDENGNIHLTIPLSGDLSDPNVGLDDVMQQVTRLAVRTSVLFFVGQALQPYTALLGVAAYAGDYLFSIRLDALVYENNQIDLNEGQIKNLTKVAELMREKKKIEVKACPFVNAEEEAQYGSEWPSLARKRGEMIKIWMDDYDNTLSSRLSICRPQRGDIAQVVLGVN